METKAKYTFPGWQWIVAALVFFVAVLTLQKYILFDIEQSRVLVYECDKILTQLMFAGGIADFIALFLQQFFLSSIAGAAIMSALFVAVSWLLHRVYKSAIGRNTYLSEDLICCIPAALLFAYTEGLIFFITGHVAILLACIGLLSGVALVNMKNLATYILLPLLIIFTGFATSTAVWPMVAALVVYSLLYKKNYIAAGITVASAALMVGLARYTLIAVTDDELFSPDFFSYRLKGETVMPFIWASIVLVTVIPLIVKKFVAEKIMKHISMTCVMLLLVLGVAYKGYKDYHSEEAYTRLEMQHNLDTENYEAVLDFTFEYLQNTYMANIYYMAYSRNNELENEVGGILQAPDQLIMPGNTIRIVRRHLMSLYYYLGYVSGAQREAFEYNEPTEGMMVPKAIKILALTNIAEGNYAAAEKYINYLDHTLFYSDWAQQYRKFLYNDKAVEKDPELGPRRKAMNIESVPQTWTTLPHIIRQISSVAPELPATNYKKAFRRLGAYNINRNETQTPKQSYIAY